MDLLRVNPNTFVPDTLIEGYNSLIWTERFKDNGEFEVQTARVTATKKALPEGSFLTLRDSKELMIVETHSMKNGFLTLSGRTFETFLENRVLLPTTYGEPWSCLRTYEDAEFIALLLWMHLVNASGEDPTRLAMIDPYTAVPMVAISTSATNPTAYNTWSLEGGEVYEALRRNLELGVLGVRNIRPAGASAKIMSFNVADTGGAIRGTPIYTQTENVQQLLVDVYHGTNRTRHQSTVPAVVFHHDAGHIDSPEYLISIKDSKNMGVVVSSIGNGELWPNTTPPPDTTVSGLDRRQLYIDGGSRDEGTSIPVFLDMITQNAYVTLEQHPKTIMFDGNISPLVPYTYNTDYFLGDQVTLIGEFGFEESMIVSEYVRTQDTDGESGYPGLVRKEEYDNTRKRTIKGLPSS